MISDSQWTCDSCIWWKPPTTKGPFEKGQCQRDAPQVIFVNGDIVTVRPTTYGDDKCRHWTEVI